jgi:hypothetical protein
MRWFKAHLNVASSVTYPLALGAYFYSDYLNHRPGAYFEGIPSYAVFIQVVLWLTFFTVNLWVLKQKGQSLFLVLGAGAFFPILLPNKRRSQPILGDDIPNYIEKNATDSRLRFKIIRLPWIVWFPLGAIFFAMALLIPFIVISRFSFDMYSIYSYLLVTCSMILMILAFACFSMASMVP